MKGRALGVWDSAFSGISSTIYFFGALHACQSRDLREGFTKKIGRGDRFYTLSQKFHTVFNMQVPMLISSYLASLYL